jgi:chromosome segregation ATPase
LFRFEKCRLVEGKVGSYLKEYKCLEEKQSKLEESIRSLENDDIHQSLESTINEWNEKEGNVRQELQVLQTKYEENIQYKRQLELSVEEKKEQLEKAKQDRIKMEQLQEQIKTKQMELERITQLCEQEQDNLAELGE